MAYLDFPASQQIPSFPSTARASPAADRRIALIVLGMHRSGTSAMARVLNLRGGALPRHAMAGVPDRNPLGHWEPLRIVELHDRYLENAGTDWGDYADYPAALFHSDQAAACQSRLFALARKEYGDARLFVLKDPRTSRLMPLWAPVLDKLQADPRIVLMVRSPLEVADSLRARDGWDEYRALVVWMRYMLSAERDTRGMPRCFISYDNFLADWRSSVAAISERLEIDLNGREPLADAEIDRFVRQDLRHHHHPSVDLSYRSDIADCVKRTYRCFCDAVELGDADPEELDAIGDALDSAGRTLKRIRGGLNQPHLQAVSNQRRDPTESDALAALVLADRGQLQNAAEHAERRLAGVLASRSWRWVQPFRTARDSVRRLRSAMRLRFGFSR